MNLYSVELNITLSKEQNTAIMGELSRLKKGSEHEYEVTTIPQKFLGVATGYTFTMKTSNPDLAMLALSTLKKN